jgi:hypothetical protein
MKALKKTTSQQIQLTPPKKALKSNASTINKNYNFVEITSIAATALIETNASLHMAHIN